MNISFLIKNKISAILNAHGNVMIPIVQLFVIQFANPQNVILLALNPKTLFVTLNVKNLNAKLNVLIKDVKCLTVLNVLPSANNLIA